MSPALLSIPAAARHLGIGRNAVLDLVARGDLATIRIGKRQKVTRASVDALVSQPKSDTSTPTNYRDAVKQLTRRTSCQM